MAAAAAGLTRREGRFDVLINNAGVFEGLLKPEEITAPDAERIFAVNVIGVVRMTQAFLPLLRASVSPVIVNVSSGLARSGGHRPRVPRVGLLGARVRTSTAAVGMLTVQYAKGLPDLLINAADPASPRPASRQHRPPDRRGGHRRDRAAGHHRPGRPHRHPPEPHRARALVGRRRGRRSGHEGQHQITARGGTALAVLGEAAENHGGGRRSHA